MKSTWIQVEGDTALNRLPARSMVSTPEDSKGSWDAADEAAYAGLYLRAFPSVLRTVRFIVGSGPAAEDATQDAFVQLYVHWRKVSRYESPEGWVRRVAIRQATRIARRDRLRGLLSIRAAGSSEERATASALADDADVRRAVELLRPNQRAVVALYYFEDLPIAEVARMTGWSQTNVKVTLHRARRILAEHLGVRADQDG